MKRQQELLVQLNAIEESADLRTADEKVNVFDEPSATLPLWRRVDRQFWWNEWLSKPFVDAGVRQWGRGHDRELTRRAAS